MDLAESNEPIPGEWTGRTEQVAAVRSKTYTVALGTALLAKATDDRVDALCLKERAGNRAYSARSLAHGVLVPVCRQHRVDLRATGREPLNNQPFFRYERVDRMDRVKYANEHAVLVETLERVNDLRADEALIALAAFLRSRIAAARAAPRIDLRHTSGDLLRLRDAACSLLAEDAEGGKRAQALVAACFDLVFDDVRTQRVNDPSRAVPGDVQAYWKLKPVVACEVRSKPVLENDIQDFLDKVIAAGFPEAVVAALGPSQPDIDCPSLSEGAWHRRGLLLVIHTSYAELLIDAMAWSRRPLDDSLRRLPELVDSRLQQLEARPATRQRWRDLIIGEGEPVVKDSETST